MAKYTERHDDALVERCAIRAYLATRRADDRTGWGEISEWHRRILRTQARAVLTEALQAEASDAPDPLAQDALIEEGVS